MQISDIQKIVSLCNELKIDFLQNEPLSKHTSFKIGGNAALFCMPINTCDIAKLMLQCKKLEIPFFILGKGSNTLFCDAGYNGVVICPQKNDITISKNIIYADAGVSLAVLCKAAAQAGLCGLEFAYGIPGTVGGAIYMNAGAYGGEIKDAVCSIKYLNADGEIAQYTNSQAKFEYRNSVFQQTGEIILGAEFCLQQGDKTLITEKMHQLAACRKEKQPLEYPSAGSTFKRPVGAYAGALIEQCGLRGFRVGGAAISEKHCGFVVNLGGATCKDVEALTNKVIKIVKEKTGFDLEREIKIINV